MSEYLENYKERLERKMSFPLDLKPDKSGKLPVVDIHAWFGKILLDEECPRDVQQIYDGVMALCASVVAYEDALLTTMHQYQDNPLIHEILQRLEEVYAEEVIQ